MPIAFWSCASVTTVNALVSLDYSTAAVRTAGTGSDAGRVPSMYAFTRSLALATSAVAATLGQSVAGLNAAALAMVLVQTGDAVIGVVTHDRVKTFGPAATALVNGVALIRLRQA